MCEQHDRECRDQRDHQEQPVRGQHHGEQRGQQQQMQRVVDHAVDERRHDAQAAQVGLGAREVKQLRRPEGAQEGPAGAEAELPHHERRETARAEHHQQQGAEKHKVRLRIRAPGRLARALSADKVEHRGGHHPQHARRDELHDGPPGLAPAPHERAHGQEQREERHLPEAAPHVVRIGADVRIVVAPDQGHAGQGERHDRHPGPEQQQEEGGDEADARVAIDRLQRPAHLAEAARATAATRPSACAESRT